MLSFFFIALAISTFPAHTQTPAKKSLKQCNAQQIIGKDYAHYIGYEVPGFDINKTFYEISQKDFQGAISQAESFSDKYLRTLAVLASVKDCEKNETPVKPKAKNK